MLKLGLVVNKENRTAVDEAKYNGLGFQVFMAAKAQREGYGIHYVNSFNDNRMIGGTLLMSAYAPTFHAQVSEQELERYYKMLKPELVVMPIPLDRFRDFWLNRLPISKRLYVLNSLDFDELETTVYELSKQGNNIIGLASRLEMVEGGRKKVADMIAAYFGYNVRLFMLGIHKYPEAEVKDVLSVFPDLEGVVTSAPIAYAQANLAVSDKQTDIELNWNRKANYYTVQRNVRQYTRFLWKEAKAARKAYDES